MHGRTAPPEKVQALFRYAALARSFDADLVLLGGGGGTVRGGRILDYRNQPERQMCRLFLSLLAKFGLDLPRFGDATSPLAEL